VPVDVITRVAINRLTGAADEGKLFDLEAIPPGVEFYFFTVLENMKDEEHDYKSDFAKGIRALNLQLASVGAHSTVGFGMVDVKHVFTATIDRGVFDEGVEHFIATTIQQDVETPVDLDKIPEFFQALVIAHAQSEGEKKLLNSKITIKQGDGNDNQEATG
jgi:CRISPR/Cas system CSM-associated protein Csm3 (group 7 of RAMP superfamily)